MSGPIATPHRIGALYFLYYLVSALWRRRRYYVATTPSG
jgi:hypothetical protein